jgi:phosphoglycerate dehydrogenase-like enzyme
LEDKTPRKAFILLLVFGCSISVHSKKVVDNLSPQMLKELAASAPNVKTVAARGAGLAKEVVDADAIIGVSLTPELLKLTKRLKWLHSSSAG